MDNLLHYAVFCVSVLVSSVSQLLLKQSAGLKGGRARQYLNPRVITAYFLFFFSALMTVWAYRRVPLSAGAMLEASGYLYVTILSRLVLKESVTRRTMLGLGLILLGILVYAV